MKDNYTHITIVMDRTGSMADVREDAEGAVNFFLTEQKDVPGECSLLFIDFDSDEPQRIVHDGPLSEMDKYKLQPRNSTPLLYAVGKALDNTGERLSKMAEDNRPGKVIFVIQTDGLENHSHYMGEHPYTWEHVREMIKIQETDYNWQIIFLGMGADSWEGGQRLGVSNIVGAAATGISHSHTHSTMSAYASDYRRGATADMSRTRGMHVNSAGKVFSAEGDEIDPKTGKPIEQPVE